MSDKRQKKDPNDRLKLKEARTGTSYWMCLSDEMVLFILRHLPKIDLVTVSLINKKFRDLSRDDSLWTELSLDYQDIKQAADSCRKLVERCKKLESLEITNESRDPRPLNIMSVVIRAKKSLKRLDVDRSIRKWTDFAMAKLGEMEELKSIKMTFNAHYQNPNGVIQFPKLHQLENLCVHINNVGRYGIPGNHEVVLTMMKNVLQQFKKLRKIDINIADESLVEVLAKNNPDLKKLLFCYRRGYHYYDHSLPPVMDSLLQRLRSKFLNIDFGRYFRNEEGCSLEY